MVAAGTTRKASGGTCQGFTTTTTQCTLTFDNAGLKGTTRLLLFARADDHLRWTLVD